jgi:hypothetical protein
MNENATALIPEIVQDNYPENFLAELAKKKIEKSEVKPILEDFSVSVSLFAIAEQARSIVVTDESQTDLMAQARELRLKLKAERVRIGKSKDEIKEPYLRKTQVIDGVHLIIKRMFEAEEEYLQQQEDFAKVREEQRIQELANIRREQLLAFNCEVSAISSLGSMSDSAFELMLSGAKAVHEENLAELARQEQEEKDRLAREAELKAENDRLRLEKEESDRKVEAERLARQQVEDQARRDREAAEQKERDRVAAEDAERQRQAAEAQAKLLAPDREKLLAYAQEISKLRDDAPTMSTDATRAALDMFRADLVRIQNNIENYANSLSSPSSDCPF